MICAYALLSLLLMDMLRRKQIEIERDIYNGLFHTAFSQSRNNKHDLKEKEDHRRLFTTTLSMIIVRNESF
jgi:hypothetical protein